ncbi:MAG TPA: hypothetical protein VHB79_09765 [Polyangiaceae bacterium]|nr:hypothetical protein [Polyangiaceae bacterium]
MRRLLLAAALGASPLFVLGGAAHAKPRAASAALAAPVKPQADAPDKLETVVEVSVLHGTHEPREKDARSVDMAELREGPFAQYASYQLLSRTQLTLSRGGKRQLKLPNGRLLEARLEDKLSDGSSRLVASINRPDAKDFLPLLEVKASPGQAFIVAGQSYKHGILVLVFKVVR